MINETVSHYRVLRKLGGGGMGVVYEAEDLSLGRHVALKFLPEGPRPATTRPWSASIARRARRRRSTIRTSARSTRSVEHEGQFFIAMEMLEGKTLKHSIGGKPLPIETAAASSAVADRRRARGRARARGSSTATSSRPTSSSPARGQAKVLDFGLAKMIKPDGGGRRDATITSRRARLIGVGTTLGTVAYMSPEQALGRELDARSDLFSFGIVLYEMATGVLPFTGRHVRRDHQCDHQHRRPRCRSG